MNNMNGWDTPCSVKGSMDPHSIDQSILRWKNNTNNSTHLLIKQLVWFTQYNIRGVQQSRYFYPMEFKLSCLDQPRWGSFYTWLSLIRFVYILIAGRVLWWNMHKQILSPREEPRQSSPYNQHQQSWAPRLLSSVNLTNNHHGHLVYPVL